MVIARISAVTTPATTLPERSAWPGRGRRSARIQRMVACTASQIQDRADGVLRVVRGPDVGVVDDHAVEERDPPVGGTGDPCVMGDEQDRLALVVDLFEQPYDVAGVG